MRLPALMTVVIVLLCGRAAAEAADITRLPSQTAAGGYCAALLARGAHAGNEETAAAGSPSPARAGVLSFLLPGLGQQRMGRTGRAGIYLSLEAAGWITFGASMWQSFARREAYEEYAVAYAGVSGTGYGKDYYRTVGSFTSNEGPGGYNEYVRRDARDLYYPNLDEMESYYEQHAIGGDMGWRWETDSARRRFNALRHGSELAARRAIYAGFFLLGLRVVSAVDAVVAARETPADGEAGVRRVSVEVGPRPGGFYFALSRPF